MSGDDLQPLPGHTWTWVYFKMGTCALCEHTDKRLWRPSPSKDFRLIHFPAICQRCAEARGANIPNPY